MEKEEKRVVYVLFIVTLATHRPSIRTCKVSCESINHTMNGPCYRWWSDVCIENINREIDAHKHVDKPTHVITRSWALCAVLLHHSESVHTFWPFAQIQKILILLCSYKIFEHLSSYAMPCSASLCLVMLHCFALRLFIRSVLLVVLLSVVVVSVFASLYFCHIFGGCKSCSLPPPSFSFAPSHFRILWVKEYCFRPATYMFFPVSFFHSYPF